MYWLNHYMSNIEVHIEIAIANISVCSVLDWRETYGFNLTTFQNLILSYRKSAYYTGVLKILLKSVVLFQSGVFSNTQANGQTYVFVIILCFKHSHTVIRLLT